MLARARRAIARIEAFLRRRELDRDFADELASHLSFLIEEQLRRGLTPEEARRRASIKLGSAASLHVQHRDVRGLPVVDLLLCDLRFALRRLAARPGLTILMMAILAIGVGANTAVFAVVDQVLFRLPPYANAGRLVEVAHLNRPGGGGGNSLAPDKILGWQSQTDVFERFEAYAPQPFEVLGHGEPERIHGVLVTTALFDMLGVSPRLGRRFDSPDGKAGAPHVVMISDGLWKRRFGADPSIVGQAIVVNGDAHTIIGVMPPRFGLSLSVPEALWVPVDVASPGASGDVRRFMGLAWRPRDMSLTTTQTRVDQIAEHMQTMLPLQQGWHLGLRPRTVAFVDGSARNSLMLLWAAVSLVLLIVAANLANLFLIRATGRSRELSIRAALGATRAGLVRESLVESALLSVIGAAIGLVMAHAAIRLAFALAPSNMYFLTSDHIQIDGRILAVSIGMAVAIGLFAALIPAIRATGPSLEVSDGASNRIIGGGTGPMAERHNGRRTGAGAHAPDGDGTPGANVEQP